MFLVFAIRGFATGVSLLHAARKSRFFSIGTGVDNGEDKRRVEREACMYIYRVWFIDTVPRPKELR